MSRLSDLDPIERQLRPWLAEEGTVREPDDLFERVASGTRSVRQRPGWVVRILGNGLAGAGAGPAARWREHRMASALGLGTVVVVAAIGIGSLGSGLGGPSVAPGAVTDAPSPSASPAASTAPVEPVAVTGAQTSELVHSFGSTVEEDGVYHTRLPWWTMTWEADDSRLSGEGTWVVNWNWLLEDGPSIGTAAYVLVNPGGRWVGTGQGYGDGSADHSLVVLHGEGDYDGLTATLLMRGDAGSITFEGMIFPFEPPEVPVTVEPPAD